MKTDKFGTVVRNAVFCNSQFKVGDPCKVFHQGNWVDGKITKVDGNYADVKLDDSFGTTILHLSTTGTFASVKARNSVARNSETEVSARDVKVGQTIDTDEAIGIVKEVKGGWVYYETAYGMKKVPTASRVILINSVARNAVAKNADEGFAKSDWAKYTFRQLGDCYANVKNLVTSDCPPELSHLIGLAASAIATALKESKKYL